MIYSSVLLAALCLAFCNKGARPFAVVMALNWAVNDFLARNGFWVWVSISDAVAFMGFAALTVRRPTWWSFLVSELAFGAVVTHVLYWTLFGFGLYFGPQYQKVLNAAFGIAALVLIYGSYDVGNLLGAAWRSVTRAPYLRRRYVHPRSKASRGDQKGFW